MEQEKTGIDRLEAARAYADKLILRNYAPDLATDTRGAPHMTSSEYNDNRPQDGQDERERTRAEVERYDLETVERFELLLERFRAGKFLNNVDAALTKSLRAAMFKQHRFLLDEEGL